ncbi:protein-methionine-sulfoxide reductase heme-binding subunit MsrQ [Paraglaciecola aquimarina]|uniref:Protein-methionine-sulfoxide reductase heme-binding subunit MsrQ n=1 Tax=Paraglaciecola algarum TaxID=3050085 RepID=A0ABS9DBN5_9ALTE|nr:protein-methionine-sulfoxide reductase heme-binding subunit MsrQ [Paraglaciecola sp. G1-23]MCF2950382.1 protein-methionine-sulfoxide reductase heme-binding subunit MsrQ [Paraglaciecola sp. G1-23]
MIKLKIMHMTVLKTIIHLVSLGLLVLTFYQAINDQLGADPVEALLHFTGIGAFNLLLLSLLVSPLAKFSKQIVFIRIRRLLGLYAFFYGLSHFVSYIIFELQLEWTLLLSEIIKRPYITVGFAALLILTALTITSTQSIQRKMGRTWQKLHNWVYVAGLLVALHFIWSVKSNLIEPLIYWLILTLLLATRTNKLKLFYRRRFSKNPPNKK